MMTDPGPIPGIYRIDIEKRLGEERWSNVYYGLPEGGQGFPLALVDAILAAERAVTHGSVTFTRTRVASTDPGDNTYRIVQHGVTGSRSFTGELLPLFCAVRVELATVAGRPSRKYLRGIITEGEINFNALGTQLRTEVNNNYATPIAAAVGLVDLDGQEIVSAAVVSDVAMRQLRRRSRYPYNPQTGQKRS